LPTSSALRRLAETPDRFTALSPDVERFADDRVCVLQGPTWASVTDIHTDDVEALLAEVRTRVPAEKQPIWWIAPSCEPSDLYDRLLAQGLRTPADRGAWLYAMASETPPPEAPGVEVRRVETYEDFLVATQVAWEGFGTPEERRERDRPHLRSMYEATHAAGTPVGFVAFSGGEPVGVGRSVYADAGVFLIAGAVLEHARRRGVYKALVRARWEDAVARGTPGLVVEAMPDTSYPILKRIGFEEVAVIRRLEDA
jgi:ribosomal protein S18 acetylase RimI-like enzyme